MTPSGRPRGERATVVPPLFQNPHVGRGAWRGTDPGGRVTHAGRAPPRGRDDGDGDGGRRARRPGRTPQRQTVSGTDRAGGTVGLATGTVRPIRESTRRRRPSTRLAGVERGTLGAGR